MYVCVMTSFTVQRQLPTPGGIVDYPLVCMNVPRPPIVVLLLQDAKRDRDQQLAISKDRLELILREW
jgi:hypothetical protein